MGVDNIGLYYDINKALLPEAFQQFHQVSSTLCAARQVSAATAATCTVKHSKRSLRRSSWLMSLYMSGCAMA